jgi:hypothetical protein
MTAIDTTLPNVHRVSAPSRRDLGVFASLAGVILTLKPSSRGSPELPSWLRRDIGLPPDAQTRSFWDYR